tara:strand:- start:182 stop:346 length:165 start_codon:yes stop_codon:yes gene_type:complete
MKGNKKIVCPDCQTDILVKGKKEVGDILECSECGTEVEILCLDPLKYEELFEEK